MEVILSIVTLINLLLFGYLSFYLLTLLLFLLLTYWFVVNNITLYRPKILDIGFMDNTLIDCYRSTFDIIYFFNTLITDILFKYETISIN